ncbi:DUF4232 domain-containing protein [Nocardia aurantiaca]|uniref:DUF4232 domain-containing protein n=1 Tax=Nocardia aurantiaca TaxID=2675850 RepID=A0A6I3L1F4_9NOCA|nr:DUF4232 domain-containing protein [Nocardia aurantiaca]MTE14525.1 DUF4232 domain-containing protein [Nocardia aurantiaca]
MRTTGFTALLACAVLSAAACSTSTSPGPVQSGTPATPAAASTPGVPSGNANPGDSPATGTPESTAPQPTDTSIAACAPGQVDITVKGMGAATNHHGLTLVFSIANPAQACTLTGYPGLDETAETGEVIHAERTPNGYMGGLPAGTDKAPTVVVKSGHPARAIAEAVSCGVYGKPDPTVTKVEVTAPNSTDIRVIPESLSTCNLKIHPVTQ